MSSTSLPIEDLASERIPVCQHEHDDFVSLAQHVAADFRELDPQSVVQELRVAEEAVSAFDLGEEALRVAELIARHRLLLRTGSVADVARLDPQSHPARSRAWQAAEPSA